MMADAEAPIEADVDQTWSAAQAPLVTVTFQKNQTRVHKYLEAEPKALGITQITLGVFQISWAISIMVRGQVERDIPLLIASVLVIIAGSLAVAAQNLHLPTLKACLGMQVVACIATLLDFLLNSTTFVDMSYCWNPTYHENGTLGPLSVCRQVENAHYHCYAENILIHAALVAISVTLAAYCCKVVNCCSPAPKMPVITLQAPPAQHTDAT